VRFAKIWQASFAAAVEPAIYAVATGASTEASNLAVAIVDEDHSDLSRRIRGGLTPPTFQPAGDRRFRRVIFGG
jgi:hypothetical protein